MATENGNSRLVYSTDGSAPATVGKSGARADKRPGSSAGVNRGPTPAPVPDDGVVRISRDKKGRRGKTATLVTGLPGNEAGLDGLLKRLKSSLGSGGAREGRTLILQGDHRERLMKDLTALGHKPRLAGG